MEDERVKGGARSCLIALVALVVICFLLVTFILRNKGEKGLQHRL